MNSAIRNSQVDLGGLLPAASRSSGETRTIGRALSENLRRGDIVALYGNLGAGKTVLVRGICEGLGLDPQDVTSPTFTIVHEYAQGRMPIYHFDAYRIARIDEFYGLGYEEYFFGDGLSIVEWADKIDLLLPDHAIRIRIEHRGGDERLLVRVPIDIEADGRSRHDSD